MSLKPPALTSNYSANITACGALCRESEYKTRSSLPGGVYPFPVEILQESEMALFPVTACSVFRKAVTRFARSSPSYDGYLLPHSRSGVGMTISAQRNTRCQQCLFPFKSICTSFLCAAVLFSTPRESVRVTSLPGHREPALANFFLFDNLSSRALLLLFRQQRPGSRTGTQLLSPL